MIVMISIVVVVVVVTLLCTDTLRLVAGYPTTTTEVSLDSIQEYQIKKGETKTFCYTPEEQGGYSSIFDNVVVEVTASENFNFPWHSIRGVSSDDFHSNLETVVFKLMGEGQLLSEEKQLSKHSYVRDVLSACPSPLKSKNRYQCAMYFSPYGRSCVSVSPEDSVSVTVYTSKSFNTKMVLNLLIGVGFITITSQLAKSKLFQVGTSELECI